MSTLHTREPFRLRRGVQSITDALTIPETSRGEAARILGSSSLHSDAIALSTSRQAFCRRRLLRKIHRGKHNKQQQIGTKTKQKGGERETRQQQNKKKIQKKERGPRRRYNQLRGQPLKSGVVGSPTPAQPCKEKKKQSLGKCTKGHPAWARQSCENTRLSAASAAGVATHMASAHIVASHMACVQWHGVTPGLCGSCGIAPG